MTDDRNAAIAPGAEAPTALANRLATLPKNAWTDLQKRSAVELTGLIALAFVFSSAAWGTILFCIRPDPEDIYRLLNTGRYKQAAELARRYLKADPTSTIGLIYLGKAQAELRDYAGLALTLSRVSDRSARKVEADALAGTALLELNRCREAERFYLDVLKHSPRGFRGHCLNARRQLLRLYGLEGRKEAFLRLVRETIEVVPKFDRRVYLTMRMRLEFEHAVPENNRRILEAMIAADPLDPNALAGLGSVCILEGRVAEAERLFQKALSLAPDDRELRERTLDAVVLQPDSAAKIARVLDERVPGSDSRPRTAYFLGLAAETKRAFEEAARHYSRACEADPSRFEYPYKLSQVLRRLGRTEQAKARELDRDRIQKARSALREAWNVFAETYETGPSRVEPSMLLNLAVACDRLGWIEDARAWYRETLLDDPDNAEARKALNRS